MQDTHAKLQRTYGDQKGQMEALQAQAQDIQKQLLSSEAKMQVRRPRAFSRGEEEEGGWGSVCWEASLRGGHILAAMAP